MPVFWPPIVIKGESQLIATIEDLSGLSAGPRILRGTRADDALDVERANGGLPSTEGWWVEGRGGIDDLAGSDGADVIATLAADIVLEADTGGAGRKLVIIVRKPNPDRQEYGETAQGGAGDDLVLGAGGDDELVGDTGDDVILGQYGNDSLDGGAGDDWLADGAGSNTLIGGDGTDTVSWAGILKQDIWTRAVGVMLNLSGETLVLGNDNAAGRMTITDLAGGVIGTAGRMLNNKHPELMRVADGEAGKLEQDAAGGPRVAIDTLSSIERFEGGASRHDVAVLDATFMLTGTDADGWTAYSDGTTTHWLRGFEHVFFA